MGTALEFFPTKIAITAARTSNTATLLTQNSALSAPNAYSSREKAVNDILLRSVAQGVFVFSAQDSATLQAIAALCPLSDGEAVLRARALLTLVLESPALYDDNTICDPERGRPGVAPQSNYLKVYPNPVNDKLTIEYKVSTTPENNFLLWNSLGQLVKTVELSSNMGSTQVSVEGLAEGVYWYTLLGSKGSFISGKVIISH